MKKLVVCAAMLFASTAYSQELKTQFNWFNLDQTENGVRGISTEKAYKELLKGRKSTPVVVGVIDSGIDINHEDLKSRIWVNKNEIPGNGIDDDKNGFVDDIYGWDFLGNTQGQDINGEQLEKVRIYNSLAEKFGEKPSKKLLKKNKSDYELMNTLKEEIEASRKEAEQYLPMYQNLVSTLKESEKILKEATGEQKLTKELVQNIKIENIDRKARAAREVWLQMNEYGGLNELNRGVEHFEDQLKYNYNYTLNDRATIIGDNPKALEYGKYGNNEVTGPDALHGTHVAGIIGAHRDNNLGMKGVADNVQIMTIRAVPNGDELDKDVANAIRYAVDNGARVVNMSFGKGFSPQKSWVDDAVKYADSKGVLLVAAAGNDGANVDVVPQYPNRISEKGQEFKNWISVGALDYKGDDVMAASFSNYGKKGVDVFAPGVAIYSTTPGSEYQELEGTSMASPVVAGLASLLFSYFPELTHYQVKEIILKSVVTFPGQEVKKGDEKFLFSDLSTTGGVVNAYEAVKLAIEMTNK